MGFLSNMKNMMAGEKVDFHELIKNGAVVVDVRTEGEFSQGSFKGSVNIPLSRIQDGIKQLEGKKVVIVCQSGGRAEQAKSFLTQNGIESYNAKSWRNL
jgi:phage shock protein E